MAVRHQHAAWLAVLACVLFLPACGKKNKRVAGVPQTPAPSQQAQRAQPTPARQGPLPVGYVEEGLASWYGIPFHGRQAADGEIYDMETLVAAHKLMPFNTWLKVTNLSNGRVVNVRIIDRGPFVDGRIIDLSKAAARQIELLGPGVGKVRLEVISEPVDLPADDFYAVQVGAFSVYANAEQACQLYGRRYGHAQVAARQGRITLWRVLVGKEPTMDAAQQLAGVLSVENKDVFVVRLDPPVSASRQNAVPPLAPRVVAPGDRTQP